jgi:Flp pilus assembly protein TadG
LTFASRVRGLVGSECQIRSTGQPLRVVLSQKFNRFSQSADGTAALEFGLVAAPFLALLVALFQTAMVFFASRVLDEIVANASRYIMTGQAQTSGMTQSGFATYVCGQTLALFNCQNFMINVQNYSSFSAASTATPTLNFNGQGGVANTWTWSPGNPGDVVVLQVMYLWPVVLGPLGFNLANVSSGNRLLISTAVFKNEPY